MTPYEMLLALPATVLMIYGGLCVYLSRQNISGLFQVNLVTKFDKNIPIRAEWSWVYLFLFFPSIISIITFTKSYEHYFLICISFIFTLLVQIGISLIFEASTPATWRAYEPDTPSRKLLAFVHSMDKGGNCFPSMHVASGTLAALHLFDALEPTFGPLVD